MGRKYEEYEYIEGHPPKKKHRFVGKLIWLCVFAAIYLIFVAWGRLHISATTSSGDDINLWNIKLWYGVVLAFWIVSAFFGVIAGKRTGIILCVLMMFGAALGGVFAYRAVMDAEYVSDPYVAVLQDVSVTYKKEEDDDGDYEYKYYVRGTDENGESYKFKISKSEYEQLDELLEENEDITVEISYLPYSKSVQEIEIIE